MIKLDFMNGGDLNEATMHKLEAVLGYEVKDYGDFLRDKDEEGCSFDKFFYEVLAENNQCTIWIDWKWAPEDIEWQVQKIVPEAEFRLVSSRDNTEYIAYDIEFEIKGQQISLTVNFEDPNELIEAINKHLSDKQLVDLNFGDDQYTWLLVPADFKLEEFCALTGAERDTIQRISPTLKQRKMPNENVQVGTDTESTSKLSSSEAQRVERGEALDKDYFYIPVIYYSKDSPNYEQIWYSLRFNDKEPPASLLAYASKVPAGNTLWQTVRNDLEKDFKYPQDKSFVIEYAKPFDTAKNKQGQDLTRFLVWVGVYEKFDTTDVNPLGLKLEWYEEGEYPFSLISKYFNKQTD